jgi:TonB-dependent starch-binding outer membrane protein SusC
LLTQESMENVQKTRRLFASAYGCKASRSFLIWSLSAAMSISVAPMMAEVSSDVRNFGTQLVTQVKSVTGTIIDETGEPMIGVSVLVQGTTTGTVTDLDGKFVLEVPANATLVISYIGYKTQNIKVGSQHAFAIKMESDNEVLDEVVVVGYGVVKKRDLTGSVSSVKAGDIQKTASSNAMQAMQAKVPGLDIQQSSGQAGSGININLRGNRSINADNSPLILVDGVEYGSTIDINPSDIESMEVLKDASSTAIYGTKGANGVIIISTKRGKARKTKVNLNAYVSVNEPTNIPKVMYGEREVRRLLDAKNYKDDIADGSWGTHHAKVEDVLGTAPNFGLPYSEMDVYNEGSYTDWPNLLLKNGLTQNYDLSISGGSEKTTFNISMGAMVEGGLLKNDKLARYNGKLSVDHKVNDILKVGMDMLYTHKNHDKRSGNVFGRSLYMSTIAHPYDADGNIILRPSPYYEAHANPLLDDQEGAYDNNIVTNRLFATSYLQLTPIKGLTLKTLFNVDYQQQHEGLYRDYQSVSELQSAKGSYISNDQNHYINYTWDNTLNYITDFGGSDHSLTLLLGSSTKRNEARSSQVSGYASAEHYYKSSFYDVSLIKTPVNTSSYTKTTMQSYFGRVNYSYKSKYLLAASLRADGSSVLAKGHKWGYFPSVAVAWRVSDENFMESTRDWLDNLKLRASWGSTGNAGISAYQTLPMVNADNQIYYEFGSGVTTGRIPTTLGNENLTWETTTSYNFGVDFGFWGNRIYGSADFYINKTKDLLYAQSLPLSSVYSHVLSNIGKTKGHGFEIQIGGVPVRTKNFNWDTTLSVSTAKDEIVELSNGLEKNINGRTGQIVGQPLNIYYYYEADGCWGVGEFETYKADWEASHPGKTLDFPEANSTTGDVKIVDRNDDGKITDDDKRVYDRSPKCILGWNNTLTYKDFSLSFLVYARLGGWMEYGLYQQFRYDNANWADLDYWTPENQGARFPTPGLTKQNTYAASTFYEKSSYIKIKDITLSYNLPKTWISKIGMSNLRVYGSMKNFFTFSSVDNYDPERDGDISFPLTKQLVFGVNIEF